MAVREAEPVGSLQEVNDFGSRSRGPVRHLPEHADGPRIEERGHILYKQGKIPGSFYTGRGNEGVGRRRRDGDGARRRRLPAAARHGRPHHPRRRAVADLRPVHGSRGRPHARARRERPHRRRPARAARDGSHLPAMLPVAVGMGARLPDPRGAPRRDRLVRRGRRRPRRRARGDEPRRRPPAAGRVRDRQQPVGVLDPDHLGSAGEHLADRAAAYGFEGVVVDGTDVLAVYREAKHAIEKAREGGGPTLIECRDAADGGPRRPRRRLLRAEGAVRASGPGAIRSSASARGCARTPSSRTTRRDEITAGVKRLLNEALERAEESPLPDPATLTRRRVRDARGTRHATSQVM